MRWPASSAAAVGGPIGHQPMQVVAAPQPPLLACVTVCSSHLLTALLPCFHGACCQAVLQCAWCAEPAGAVRHHRLCAGLLLQLHVHRPWQVRCCRCFTAALGQIRMQSTLCTYAAPLIQLQACWPVCLGTCVRFSKSRDSRGQGCKQRLFMVVHIQVSSVTCLQGPSGVGARHRAAGGSSAGGQEEGESLLHANCLSGPSRQQTVHGWCGFGWMDWLVVLLLVVKVLISVTSRYCIFDVF